MSRQSILVFIKKLNRPIFTTSELTAISGKSVSATTQSLNFLQRQGLIFKVYRGIWAEAGNEHLSSYAVIPFLFVRHRAYVSFISALHLYGIIEQIPQAQGPQRVSRGDFSRPVAVGGGDEFGVLSFFDGFD